MTIGTLNKRLGSLQKLLSKESYKKVISDLNLPSSDFVTKSGRISTSKKLWATVDKKEFRALETKYVPTMKELRAEAKQSLESSGYTESMKEEYLEDRQGLKDLVKKGEFDEETRKIFQKQLYKDYTKRKEESIRIEIESKFQVQDDLDRAIEEWYEFIKAYGAEMAYEYPEIRELENRLYSDGLKSYTEMAGWMQDAERVITQVMGAM